MSDRDSTSSPGSAPVVLLVDDDPGQRQLVASLLERLPVRILTVESGEAALAVLEGQPVDLIISDVRLGGISGLETLRRARERWPALPVLLVTAYADIRDAVAAMQDGAVSYLEKPVDVEELRDLVRRALGLQVPPPTAGDAVPPLPQGVVAVSPAMQDVIREVALVAPSDSRVLLTGESGTGKEVIAQLLHRWSDRRNHSLLRLNCAAIPENLLESELFGHEKGAFTGAVQRRLGRFEEADGGTLLLDEISEMSPALQAKLLRVIQEGTFQRVGANTERRTDVRVLAATNRDLEQDVAAGRFREDLFYRLNVFEIHLPPLRERREDILPLAELFARRYAPGATRFSATATTCLTLYDWPGNVRELQNAMERAVLLARGGIILPEHLPRRIGRAGEEAASVEAAGEGQRLEYVERAVILQTLKQHDYNRTETARALGISRRTLIYKLRRFADEGLDVGPAGGEAD
ncbi:MAG: sigma-54-dependent Fis family transcriptional regulator [Acidobacteria bacterium]|nr:sigma-54-dependent Fis family transcriptional regulator [Acidobacteriota bacterium]